MRTNNDLPTFHTVVKVMTVEMCSSQGNGHVNILHCITNNTVQLCVQYIGYMHEPDVQKTVRNTEIYICTEISALFLPDLLTGLELIFLVRLYGKDI